MKKLILIATAIGGIVIGGAAFGSDHLADATDARGGISPLANPGKPQASPGTVPGEGNPNSGNDLCTPSVDADVLNLEAQEHLPFDDEC